MRITKHEALQLLAKIGANESIDAAAQTLPDEIDIDRDHNLLARFRLENCSELIDRYGAGPWLRSVRLRTNQKMHVAVRQHAFELTTIGSEKTL
jgi:hypothetical protein